MPGWFVAVELPTRDTTQQESAALIAACSAALGRGKCAPSELADSAQAIAVVSFRGADRLRALVEVGRREAEPRAWRSQEIAFKPEDDRLERFRTLGLAIATLARETQFEASAEKKEGTTAEPEGAAPAAGAAQKRSSEKQQTTPDGTRQPAPPVDESNAASASLHSKRNARLWINLGPLVGYDHDLPSPFRYGGRVGLAVTPADWPLYASLSGTYSVGRAPGDDQGVARVSLAWASLAAGVGGRLELPLDSEGRLGMQGTVVNVAARASDRDQEQQGQRWLLGGQLELELAVLRSRRVGFTLGASGQQLSGATAISLHGQDIASSAAFSWSVHGALELHFFR